MAGTVPDQLPPRILSDSGAGDSLAALSASVNQAARELRRLLDEVVDVTGRAGRSEAGSTGTVQLLLDRGGPARRRVVEAIAAYEHEVMLLRGAVARTLVEQCNMTVSEAAREMGISRTMAARLYRSSGPAGATSGHQGPG